jgi:hypothetical protein
MLRFFKPGLLALVVSVGLIAAFPASTAAGILPTQTNQVILSCTDGHSVILWVDSATLTSLTADVAAINSSGTRTTCTLNTSATDPSSETTEWTVYDYNPSTQEIAPRNSPNSMPATTPDNGITWTFPFKPNIYTALFTTTDPSVTGNDSGKTLTDNITLAGDALSFMSQNGGGCTGPNAPEASVRFFFTSPAASGPSVGTSPPGTGGTTGAGFYTQFWWSNPMQMPMLHGNQSQTITADMGNPGEWSDWNGQSGANPAVTEAFLEATQNVQSIGLSFGGECFFENGVTPTQPFTNEQLSSMFSAG